MVSVTIFDRQFYIDDFPQKKSDLANKKNKLSLSMTIYNDQSQSSDKLDSQISFLKNLKELPESLLITKSTRYFWKLSGCQLVNVSVDKFQEYFNYGKVTMKVTFSFKNVYGTHDLKLLNREHKLDELLNS